MNTINPNFIFIWYIWCVKWHQILFLEITLMWKEHFFSVAWTWPLYDECKPHPTNIDTNTNFGVDFTIICIDPSTTISNWLKGSPLSHPPQWVALTHTVHTRSRSRVLVRQRLLALRLLICLPLIAVHFSRRTLALVNVGGRVSRTPIITRRH